MTKSGGGAFKKGKKKQSTKGDIKSSRCVGGGV